MKNEFQVIAELIEKNKKVLDVGCGDGILMEYLKNNKNTNIRGLEISKSKVQECIAKGLTVIEGNAEKDLKQKSNGKFVNLISGGRFDELTSKFLGLKKVPAVGAAVNLSNYE